MIHISTNSIPPSSFCAIIDYISPALTSTMIHYGRQACFMRDKKGFLPIHVACSRHCSPEKLEMLLEVNPASLFAETDDNRSLLALAKGTATKSHPNYALISEIERRLEMASLSAATPPRGTDPFHVPPTKQEDLTGTGALLNPMTVGNLSLASDEQASTTGVRKQRKSKRKRKRKPVVKHEDFPADKTRGRYAPRVKRGDILMDPVDTSSASSSLQHDDSEPANLLLHFSRHMENVMSV